MKKANIDATAYEPFLVGDRQLGDVHWLRQDAGDTGVVLAGLWKAENGSVPDAFEYPFHYDETIQVLEGSVTIDFPNAPSVTLSAGDLASFAKGTTSTWRVRSPFKKFFVCS
ncbi:MAG: cupin domain-containing protein [Rhodococcus sp.]|nr:cupin domain-containing protein [Rhodococcus sp. (in: high G+C Gram-positive bacteria)]MBJ7324373.1 cupin domain-containing protein [Rhodococcus sp. (in: high G+C Gram-positive bacteria)]